MKRLFFFLATLFFVFSAQSAGATTVFSPVIELTVDAGTSQPGVVKVYNETDQDLSLTASVEKFVASGEAGAAAYPAAGQEEAYLGWFNLTQNKLTLKPKQVAIVPFTVTVPKEALPGGYYAAIFWQSGPAQNPTETAVSVNSKVGTLVLLRVNGSVTETGEILDFQTQETKKYFFDFPLNFVTRFENTGNIHLKPTGEIKITGFFGRTATIAVNPDQRNVLPQSIRRFEVIWSPAGGHNGFRGFWSTLISELKNPVFGKCTATLNLTYGQENQQTATKQFDFWLIPYHLIIFELAAILIIIILFCINRKIRKIQNREPQKPQ